ncbi:MAG: hypothetical protein MK137_09685 [Rickettsiales bacterium]|nr:hypothetical protein [Rickettsiales bacterium]
MNIENQTSLEATTELNIFYDNSIVDLYFQNAIKESYVEKTRTFRLDNNPDTQVCFVFASAIINYLGSLKLSAALTDEGHEQNAQANYILCYSNELQKEILVDFIAEMLFKFTLSHQDQDFDKMPSVCDVEADTDYIVHKCLAMWLEVNQKKVSRSDK